jgi:hypothetical protein
MSDHAVKLYASEDGYIASCWLRLAGHLRQPAGARHCRRRTRGDDRMSKPYRPRRRWADVPGRCPRCDSERLLPGDDPRHRGRWRCLTCGAVGTDT